MLIHNRMYLSYGYIINDITYQCCAYSYSFEKIGKKYIENSGYRTKRVGFIGDGASKLLAPSLF